MPVSVMPGDRGEVSSDLLEVPADLTGSLALPEQLPTTIDDAIHVTRNLGLRYLWIDKYCIPKQNLAEKQRQINQMDLVYSAAEITIVVAAGHSQQYGLPGITNGRRINAPSLSAKGVQIYCYPGLSDDSVWSSCWNSRGWTFQEMVISRRCLTFTHEQVVLECPTTSCWGVLNIDSEDSQTLRDEGFEIITLSQMNLDNSMTRLPYEPVKNDETFDLTEFSHLAGK